ncbi:MAG: enoyl-CoA hydratase [Candidatus Tectomicrobia bacterium]|uniref:Enoyl-CoA hydratase n=1 Tax=Tectimicrobiota bacterium TaxID=2528274 RepID=A0A932M175_UNCTE|nr:enoyl-CoA hydratase [Candidatus Tectomicrobia bacterium]
MPYDTILWEMKNNVAQITLNRPDQLNALNIPMCREVMSALEICQSDPQVRCVTVTGAGRAFCFGGDVKLMLESVQRGDSEGERFLRELVFYLHGMISAIRRLEKPVVGAVNGVASGAGFSLALACDLVLASDAARFNQAYVKIGLSVDGGSSYFLPRHLGMKKAAELFFTGDMIDAAKAFELGIVNRVVPADELNRAAFDLASRLAEGATLAMGRTKMLLNSCFHESLESQMEIERQLIRQSTRSQDFAEGIRAFAEKRSPKFQSR